MDNNLYFCISLKINAMWEQILIYLYLKKPKKDQIRNTNVKLMNGMNRISIYVFLIALVVMVIRLLKC